MRDMIYVWNEDNNCIDGGDEKGDDIITHDHSLSRPSGRSAEHHRAPAPNDDESDSDTIKLSQFR